MTTSCLACGGADLLRQRAYRSKTGHGTEIFSDSWLGKCEACGLVQVVPRPTLEALENYYAVDYRVGCCAGSDVANLSEFPADNLYYYNRGQAAASLVGEHLGIEPRTVLDVGAGYGHILDALGARYPDARRVAIEFSQVCANHLRSLGVEVHQDPADRVLPALDDRFDVVVLSHVLEHLLDPPEMLGLIRDHMSQEGVFYSVDTLRQNLEKAGFELITCDTAGPLYDFISGGRYRLPTMLWLIPGLIPDPVFKWLRRRSLTSGLRATGWSGQFRAPRARRRRPRSPRRLVRPRATERRAER